VNREKPEAKLWRWVLESGPDRVCLCHGRLPCEQLHGMRVTSVSVVHAMLQHNLISVGVLSGNRNWENRAHPHVKAHYLASPLLVITYALAGTVNIDFESVRIYMRFVFRCNTRVSFSPSRNCTGTASRVNTNACDEPRYAQAGQQRAFLR
jgi:hypothetical protein